MGTLSGKLSINSAGRLRQCVELCVAVAAIWMVGCNGSKKDLPKGTNLGPPVLGDDGTRSDGNDFGQIYPVTQIIEATSDIPEWANNELPFAPTRPRQQMGETYTDTQTPFKFTFTYPPNNYKLNEAHVVLETSRDTSDTEGIFVDGVFTGRIPNTFANATTPHVLHRYYTCNPMPCQGPAPSTPANTYYMDWSLTHYKRGLGVLNFFDLNLLDLLSPSPITPVAAVSDGVLRVVTGDDSPVFSALLFLEGFTVSQTPLNCTDSPDYNFQNVYIHNDNNSTGRPFFTGSTIAPNTSWSSAPSGFRSVEFHYDPRLPKISSLDNLTFTTASITLRIKRENGVKSAIVINGVGIAESGFDQGLASAEVETWDNSKSAAFSTFLSGIPQTYADTSVTLNLLNLFSQNELVDLLAQGKLNVALAGGIATAYGQNATSTRTYGVVVDGPELNLQGTFFTSVCEVPDNPNSPLNDAGTIPGGLDETSPTASSIQTINVTSNSATIQWLTNEPADSQIGYGIGNTNTLTTLDSNMNSFHSVQLTGLQPYTYYLYVVRTKDAAGNLTVSSVRTFRTLR